MDSKLQIISGMYRGRKLDLPRGARPTQNRARIALFNMLESGIIQPNEKIKVWDTFAGSGAFGIECLSRYPNASVLFTDIANDSIKTVRNNLNKVDVGVRANVIQHDAINAVQKFGADIDLVFLDPPYATPELGASFVKKFGQIAKNGTILIWEQDGENAGVPDANAWEILRDKQYGRARFLILRKIGE